MRKGIHQKYNTKWKTNSVLKDIVIILKLEMLKFKRHLLLASALTNLMLADT